jgi:hypothetical protein
MLHCLDKVLCLDKVKTEEKSEWLANIIFHKMI